jgi:hypothetical protein
MTKQITKSPEGLRAPPHSSAEQHAAPARLAARQRVKELFGGESNESFPAGESSAINLRPPEQRERLKAGLRAMHEANISCLVDYENFTIELDAEQRDSRWCAVFQICKGDLVVLPWQREELAAAQTKKSAIDAATAQAIAAIRGGLAVAFAQTP